MPHVPVRSTRTFSVRLFAALLATALGGAALLHRTAPHPLTQTPAPLWLAGDDDKGGMGGG